MTSLRDWRLILSRALSLELGSVERPAIVYPFAVGEIESLPCVVLQQGAEGSYVELGSTNGQLSTLCMATAQFTAWLTVGDPFTEQAADVLDDMITLLLAGGLRSAAGDDLNTAGFVPAVGPAGAPGATEHGSTRVWWAPVPLTVQISKIPQTIP